MRCQWPVVSFIAAVLACAHQPLHAQVQFVEVSAARGIQPYTMAPGMGGGVAAADFDDDGDIDFFVPNAEGVPNQLYRNLGNGQFEEIAAAAGLASLDRSRVALWFDYDGDQRLDLFLAGDCFQSDAECPDVSTLKLYRQVAEAQFVVVTLAAGFTDDLVTTPGQHRGGMCAGDINNDGFLDLLIGLWAGEARLFLNNGNGTFTEISTASGLGGVTAGHWQPRMYDFDGDGWTDVYAAIDFRANHLWINQRDNSFVDVAQSAGVDNAWNDMGVTLGDYDNDGDFDIYITNIFETGRHNVLFRNDSVGALLSFTEVAQAAGVDDSSFGWGTTFFDADNDRLLDLAATNGFLNPPWDIDPSKFFLNLGGDPVTFADVSTATGFDDTHYGSSLIAFDADRDGDLDLLQTCQSTPTENSQIRLLENQPNGPAANNNYLVIKPRIMGPNHRAIGAVAHVSVNSLNMMRLISAGASHMSQAPAEAFFGLGTAPMVDTVTIDWPDGTQTALTDVAANQVLTVTHGGFGDLDADGDIDEDDLAIFIPCFTGPGTGGIIYAAGCRASDIDADGDVDCDDWQVFEAKFLNSSGSLPLLEISDFVAVLLGIESDPALQCRADMDKDGDNDAKDIAPYLTALIGN